MTGKGAVVTGAGSGLGRAASVALAREGAAVLLVDIDAAGLQETSELIQEAGGRAIVFVADVSDPSLVRDYVNRARQEFGTIDAFFNNAGIMGPQASLVDYPEDSFDKVMAINVKGVFLGLKYVLPVMMEQGFGAVVNTGSMASTGALPGSTAYAAAKHAVIGLTKTAAVETAATGVRVNAILPGNIKTNMALAGAPGETVGEKEAILGATVPQGRAGLPEEIAEAVLFLVSIGAKHITGIQLPVDGGITAQVYPSASTSHAASLT
jgi:NAD(P)-dependent dehydrogenase (short-subunit alcohol dehydrogenase family)